MLHEFLTANRVELIDRCRTKVGRRSAPKATDDELTHGIPLFLDQLIKTLEVEQTLEPMQSRKVSGASGGDGSRVRDWQCRDAPWRRAIAARLHRGSGRARLRRPVPGDHRPRVRAQCATSRSTSFARSIAASTMRIADAVTEFNYQRDLIADKHTPTR